MFLRSFSPDNNKIRLIWFDLETTGFNKFKNNIIEIAAIDNLGNKFSTLVNPECFIPKKITEITHINNEMVKDSPIIQEALHDFNTFLRIDPHKTTFIIGHNSIGFDMPFIKYNFSKYNIKFPKMRAIDTLYMAQLLLPHEYSHKLSRMCELFGIDNNNAHRALSDVYATRILYNQLCVIFKAKFKYASPSCIISKTVF